MAGLPHANSIVIIILDVSRAARKTGLTACCLVGKWLASALGCSIRMPWELPALLGIDFAESGAERAFLQSLDSWHAAAVAAGRNIRAAPAQVDASKSCHATCCAALARFR